MDGDYVERLILDCGLRRTAEIRRPVVVCDPINLSGCGARSLPAIHGFLGGGVLSILEWHGR